MEKDTVRRTVYSVPTVLSHSLLRTKTHCGLFLLFGCHVTATCRLVEYSETDDREVYCVTHMNKQNWDPLIKTLLRSATSGQKLHRVALTGRFAGCGKRATKVLKLQT